MNVGQIVTICDVGALFIAGLIVGIVYTWKKGPGVGANSKLRLKNLLLTLFRKYDLMNLTNSYVHF